jgi:hypothetical protein
MAGQLGWEPVLSGWRTVHCGDWLRCGTALPLDDHEQLVPLA